MNVRRGWCIPVRAAFLVKSQKWGFLLALLTAPACSQTQRKPIEMTCAPGQARGADGACVTKPSAPGGPGSNGLKPGSGSNANNGIDVELPHGTDEPGGGSPAMPDISPPGSQGSGNGGASGATADLSVSIDVGSAASGSAQAGSSASGSSDVHPDASGSHEESSASGSGEGSQAGGSSSAEQGSNGSSSGTGSAASGSAEGSDASGSGVGPGESGSETSGSGDEDSGTIVDLGKAKFPSSAPKTANAGAPWLSLHQFHDGNDLRLAVAFSHADGVTDAMWSVDKELGGVKGTTSDGKLKIPAFTTRVTVRFRFEKKNCQVGPVDVGVAVQVAKPTCP